MFPENWHFNSHFVLKTTKTPVFVFITKILWQTFWRNKWRSVFDVVKESSYSILFFSAWAAQTKKIMFQNVAYRPTVYRTGMTCIQWLWSSVIARDQKLISRPKPFDIRAILFYRVQRFPFWKKWQTETVPPKSVCSKVTPILQKNEG